MKLIIIIIAISSLFLTSCKKNDNELTVSGEITLSAEQKLVGSIWETTGYSFETNKRVKIYKGNEDADIVPVNIVNASQQPIGMRFSSSTLNNYGFYLNDEFDNLQSAENFFKSYFNAIDTTLIKQSDPLRAFQVYTMKTSRENWVKFLVKDVRSKSTYYEADIKFVIQRNGTSVFPE